MSRTSPPPAQIAEAQRAVAGSIMVPDGLYVKIGEALNAKAAASGLVDQREREPTTDIGEAINYALSSAPISAPGQRDGHPGQSLPR